MSLPAPARAAGALALAGLVTGCGAAVAAGPPPRAVPAAASIDRLTAIARQRYAIEAGGRVARADLHRIGRDAGLLRALGSGSPAATQSYVRRRFSAVWYHSHVSRLRILQGSRVVVDVGVPFPVAPSRMTLRGTGGRSLGTLEVSIQDEIGFVRYMHRNYPVDAVVRGQGAAHVRSSLPAAAHAPLPARGAVTLAGRRYAVRSFRETAFGGEPVTVWILASA
jgi:hypothetical protein